MSSSKPSLTYRAAGVDIDAGEEVVERIKPLVARTFRKEVMAGLGGFGALFELAGIDQLNRRFEVVKVDWAAQNIE